MKIKNKVSIILIILTTLFSLISFSGYCWEPTSQLEVLSCGSPGGGLDLSARSIEQVLLEEKLTPNLKWIITCKGGGGGNIGMSYLVQQKDNPYIIAINSNRVFLNPALGTTEYQVNKDFVAIARLQTEHQIWSVAADSPYSDINTLLEKWKKDPESITFGVGTVPSDDLFNVLYVANELGIDLDKVNYISFRSGGDLLTQVAGGHIDVASGGLGEATAMRDAGKIKILSVAASEPLKGENSDIPTWKELGVDVEILHWRGIYGPPEMPDEAIQYWSDLIGKVTQTETWKKILEKHEWDDAYLSADEFKVFLEKEKEFAENILKKAGLIK